MKNNSNSIQIAIVLILVAILSRFIPHVQNFTPILAMGLFGTATFNQKWLTYFTVFFSLFFSDMIFGYFVFPEYKLFYNGILYNYLSFGIAIWIGSLFLRRNSALNIGISALFTACAFYLSSNFGCWIGNPIYTQNIEGLNKCMIAGLPFIKGTILSTMAYSMILFGFKAICKLNFQAKLAKTIIQ